MIIPDDEKSPTPQTSEPSYDSSNTPRGQVEYTQHHSNTYGEVPPPYEGRPSALDSPPNAYSGRPAPSTPVAGPSSGPSSLLQRPRGSGGGFGPAGILSDLPPAFSRPPPSNLPDTPFPPCALLSLSPELHLGFPGLPPPSTAQPHPFALRDVHEDDWHRFLDDVKRAATLSPVNRVVANVAPIAMNVIVLGSLLAISGIDKYIKNKKVGPVMELVDHWNCYFFYPRQMEVVLFQGNHPRSLSRASSDSSDSDYRGYRHQRRMDRRERSHERRREREDRRRQRSGHMEVRNERWQLVVSYKPPAFQPSTPQQY